MLVGIVEHRVALIRVRCRPVQERPEELLGELLALCGAVYCAGYSATHDLCDQE